MGNFLICLILYSYIKQFFFFKLYRDGSAKQYTINGSRENNRQGAPYAFFSRNRVSVKKCGYHNVMFAVVLASNIISGSVTT